MGITSQRLHRRKLAERQGRVASPVVPAGPALITREQHERALQELTRSYERKLGAASLALDEREEFERLKAELEQAQAHIRDLEESNAKLAGELAGAAEVEGAEGGTAGGEQPSTENTAEPAAEEPKPPSDEPKGKGSKRK